MSGPAAFVRSLDPRLKMGAALFLGPAFWLLPPVMVGGGVVFLLPVVLSLVAGRPLGARMLRSIAVFLVFWVAVKSGVDAVSGVPPMEIARSGAVLGLRLAALILVGLGLAFSASARSLGLAVAWAVRPLVGGERAWKIALSLALVVHFLPLCLATMGQVQETVSRRCPEFGFFRRMTVIPQAVLRGLGQKTWNQTLAIAGRGLEGAVAWQPDFNWQVRDTACLAAGVCLVVSIMPFV